MLIFSGDLAEKEYEKHLQEVREMITAASGEITNEDPWSKRQLAYPLKKQTTAYYIILHVRLPGAEIVELSTTIKLHPPVLRHLIIAVPDDRDPVAYKAAILPRNEDEEEAAPEKAAPAPRKEEAKSAPKETVASEEEPSEKKLEEILDNPDIDVG